MKRSLKGRGLFRRLVMLTTLVALFASMFGVARASAAADILILDTTVSGGTSSREAQEAMSLGFTVDVVTAVQWSTMTTVDFAAYKAIVLGDPRCQTSPAPALTAAENNRTVWSPAVTGNVIVVGTDPTLHQFIPGAVTLINRSINFAAAEPGKTGLYISLSCYYYNAPPNTPVPVLDQFGPFQVVGQGGCPADSHIVASHPALAGLTDADLSNWSCSTHEGFMPASIPVDFEVLAISEDIPSTYTAPDGTTGAPYIVARGVTVISDIALSPETATNPVGTQHCVTATVEEDDTPVAGTTVTFNVIAGPHIGTTGTAVTDASGQATFCYTGSSAGTDTIEATFVNSAGRTERSNRVEKTWEEPQVATIELSPASATNKAGEEHCVTATVKDSAGNPVAGIVVEFSVGGANSASGSATSDANGEAEFCYTGTNPGEDTINAFADTNTNGGDDGASEPDDTATKTYVAADPATLDLNPPTATNKVDEQHCVTATVEDAYTNPTPGITVIFTVSGSNSTGGSDTTDASGQATYCYTSALPGSDTISAYADTNGSNTQDAGELTDTATKTWAAPVNSRRCKITNGGRFTAANGDRASFGGNAHASNGKASPPSGNETYQDHGPATDMFVKANVIKSVVCSSDSTQGSVFATGKVDGVGGFQIRIDVKDLGEPGDADTYRIRVSNGYDSGEQVLAGGNIQIHK